jgi:hypothetical protein
MSSADPASHRPYPIMTPTTSAERLSGRQLRALHGYTTGHLDLVNHRVRHSGPAAALDGS